MGARDLVLDAWAALSHKRGLDASRVPAPGVSWVAPTWVGDHDRRLTAYRLLESYYRNVSREYLPIDSEAERAEHREYGDASLLVKTVVAAVLGEGAEIIVDGADDSDDATPEAKAAHERQEYLRAWAAPESERVVAKILETERDAVRLGDGVYVLGWSNEKRRVRLRLFDPGFYFPVLNPDDPEDEFPRTVHMAWEFERPDGNERRVYVRRLTWRLGPIMPRLDFEGMPLFDTDTGDMVLRDGDRFEDDPRGGRRIVRDLPWSPGEPTTTTCYMSDGTWEVRALETRKVDEFAADTADWKINEDGEQVRDLDLGIDFIPVVHLPNTVAIKEHYGESIIAAVAQLLDDLAATDTDRAKASALAGVPAIALSGATAPERATVRPGAIFNVGANGRMDVLDLSQSLPALTDLIADLLHRLSVNVRLPAEVLGRVKAGDISSGIQLALSFGPMRSLIAEMRLVRDEKYPLVFKFVQRYGMLAGELPAGETLPARLAFGSYLPNDRKGVIEEITGLFTAKLISRATALRMLVAGGIELDDIAEELERIEEEDFERALLLLEATGDEAAVFDYLHRKPPPPGEGRLPPNPDDQSVPPIPLPVTGQPPDEA